MLNTPGLRQTAKKRTAPRDNVGGIKRRSSTETDEVEVVCRLTPYNGTSPCLIPIDDKTVKCIPPPEARKRDAAASLEKAYDFGYVFDASDTQECVFSRCAVDLISNFVGGKDGLLFTYGVTGSGKTYTMTGKNTPEGTGILPRTLDVIFNSIDNKTQKCVFYPTKRNTYEINSKLEANVARNRLEYERLEISTEVENRFMDRLKVPGYNDDYVCAVFVSYVEIYNNYCYDLLEGKNEMTKRDIRVDARNYSFVEGAKEFEVESSDEALEIFCRGEDRRRTSETVLNKESSRSHSVFTIRLVMAPAQSFSPAPYPINDPERIVVSQLCLVDLAGSERAKRTQNVGSRLAEAANINKSLLVLRRCLDTLRRNQRSQIQESVPYRESKLTQLFKNYFEGGGKIRMVICANPKPDDYEENLNVLSFAEESQAVKVVRQAERLELDENRPPVPRRFYARWNQEIDEVQSSAEEDSQLPSVPPLNLAGVDDHMFAVRWKNYFSATKINETTNERNLTQNVLRLEPVLRNALCYGDYMATQCGEMKEQQEKDARYISELNAQNKQLKRELQSMAGRLRRYEENDEEMILKEAQMRKDMKEDRSKLRQQEKAIAAIQEIVTVQGSPTVAQLTKRFMQDSKTVERVSASSTPASQIRRPRMVVDKTNTPSGPGYFNPKYQRRSKSASRILDHQPLVRVPTGGILRNAYPSNTKHVLAPTTEDLRKSSDYVLTHQEVDKEGNIRTSIVKGNCIPTAGGGTAVLFNDVERLTHENIKDTPKRP